MEFWDELFDIYRTDINTARAIIVKISADRLNFEWLMMLQKSGHPDVRNMARELLLMHFPDQKDEQVTAFLKKYNLS